jgi:hypothetical protein
MGIYKVHPKTGLRRFIAPNKNFIVTNEKNIPLVATPHRAQWNFCRAQRNFSISRLSPLHRMVEQKIFVPRDDLSYGTPEKFYTME